MLDGLIERFGFLWSLFIDDDQLRRCLDLDGFVARTPGVAAEVAETRAFIGTHLQCAGAKADDLFTFGGFDQRNRLDFAGRNCHARFHAGIDLQGVVAPGNREVSKEYNRSDKNGDQNEQSAGQPGALFQAFLQVWIAGGGVVCPSAVFFLLSGIGPGNEDGIDGERDNGQDGQPERVGKKKREQKDASAKHPAPAGHAVGIVPVIPVL